VEDAAAKARAQPVDAESDSCGKVCSAARASADRRVHLTPLHRSAQPRALGVSHGSLYLHFPSKAALRDAVTERWLAEISEPLEAAATRQGTAPERLRRWLDLLVASQRRKALDEPEFFATYVELTADARDVVTAHVNRLVGHERIIADRVRTGELDAACQHRSLPRLAAPAGPRLPGH
jgi:AcrR family transcriptional regulator